MPLDRSPELSQYSRTGLYTSCFASSGFLTWGEGFAVCVAMSKIHTYISSVHSAPRKNKINRIYSSILLNNFLCWCPQLAEYTTVTAADLLQSLIG